MDDFPAAHSMDTTWFAIDRDGQVAMFETGESGCVPTDAYLGEDYGPLEDLLRALPATGAKHDLAGQLGGEAPRHVEPGPYPPPELLVFVADLGAIADLRERLGARDVASTSAACVIVRTTDRDALRALHDRGACLGCFARYESDDEGDVAEHGVYRFEHTCENWIAGPYARVTVPVRPLAGADVPHEIRAQAIAYDGVFAEATTLQPAELWSCESWEAAWLATDRKTVRPFAGREDDYAEHVDNLREVEPDLVFVDAPPPQPRARDPRASSAQDDASSSSRASESPRRPWWKFW